MKQLLVNSIQCNNCKDIITSYYTHDFKFCKCRGCSVDGGLFYQHLSGDYINLVIYDDGTHNTRRNIIWGRNYDKNNNKLPETEYIPIKDLTTEHLYNILIYFDTRKILLRRFYRDIIEDEIILRENNN